MPGSISHNCMDFSSISDKFSCKFNYPDCSNTSRNAKYYSFSNKWGALMAFDPERGMKFFRFELCGILSFFFINISYSIRFPSIRFFLIRVCLSLWFLEYFNEVFIHSPEWSIKIMWRLKLLAFREYCRKAKWH